MNAAASNEPRAWTSRHWASMVVLVFLAQCALIFLFGARRPVPVVAVTQAPSLQLVNANDEFIALSDPTLFALPHANDFGAAKRMQTPVPPEPSFRWSEPPRWLPLAGADLLNSFDRFMQTNPFATGSLDFKPEPIFSEPTLPPLALSRPHSILTLRGDLARRPLLTNECLSLIELTNWPEADVIAPSKVQVLVDAAGRVISSLLLPPDSGIVPPDSGIDLEARDDIADRRALELARAARFAPGSQITVGQMIFNWHSVPLPVTASNAPAKSP